MKKERKTMALLSSIFFLIQLFILISFIANNKRDFIYEVVIIIILLVVYTIIEIKYNLYLNNYIRASVLVSILLHVLVGEYFNIYTKSFIFDKVLHFTGTYSFSFFFYSLIRKITKRTTTSKINEFIFIFLLGISIGTFYEIIEFMTDVFFKPSIPSQGGVSDTDLDIIFNIFGSLAAAVHAVITNFKLTRI